MNHAKSREVVLAIKMTEELAQGINALRSTWQNDPHSIPKGLSCSESKAGEFGLMAAESVFTTIPGACIIKGIGAVELIGPEHTFEEGAHSKTLLLRETAGGWRFSVKYVPPIVRERNRKQD